MWNGIKVRCPECEQANERWWAIPTDGDGDIKFGEFDNIDYSDIAITFIDLMCPNPDCSFMMTDMSEDDLIDFMNENKVEDEEDE